jgi:acyl-CoA thioesterase-1
MLLARYGPARRLRQNGLALLLSLAALPALAETLTVAALGDSLTQGYGLPPEEGLVPRLEEWLQARGHDVEVLNAGVSGDTTAGGLARAAWTLAPEVDALIVALGGNDLLRGIDPAVSRANVGGILETAGEAGVEVLLVGIEAPDNYGPDYKRAFDAIWPDLAEAHGTLLFGSFFAALQEGADIEAARNAYMQPDGIHPNAEGVALIVDSLGPAVEALLERTEAGSEP